MSVMMIQNTNFGFYPHYKNKRRNFFCCCCKDKIGLSLSSISLARPTGIAMKGKLDGRDASINIVRKGSLSLIQFVTIANGKSQDKRC